MTFRLVLRLACIIFLFTSRFHRVKNQSCLKNYFINIIEGLLNENFDLRQNKVTNQTFVERLKNKDQRSLFFRSYTQLLSKRLILICGRTEAITRMVPASLPHLKACTTPVLKQSATLFLLPRLWMPSSTAICLTVALVLKCNDKELLELSSSKSSQK